MARVQTLSPRPEGSGRQRRPGVERRALLAAGIVSGVVTFTAGSLVLGPLQAAGADGFKLVGRISYGDQGSPALYTLTVDPATNRGYTVIPGTGSTPAIVRVFDLGSFKAIKDVASDSLINLGQGQDEVPNAVVDSTHHRVFFYVNQPPATFTSCSGTGIDALDETTLKMRFLAVPCLPSGSPMKAIGLAYDSQTNTLLLDGADAIAEQTPHRPVPHAIVQVDAETGAAVSAVSTSCDVFDGFSWPVDTAMIGRSGDAVFAVCQKSTPAVSGAISSSAYTLVARAPLDTSGRLGATPTEIPEIGSVFGSILDPAAGLALIPSPDPAYDLGAYVMDVNTGLFRGFVPTSNDQNITGTSAIRAFGVNAQTGRLYMQTHEGLIASDYRHLPVPVGLSYYNLADTASNEPASPQLISVDPLRSRIYVPDFSTNVPTIAVYQDDLPPIGVSSPVNPDNSTTDTPEIPGVTAANYSGAGDAFGARVLSVGGVNRVLESRLGSCGANSVTGNQQADAIVNCPYDVLDNPGDRDWYFGHVAEGSLTNVGASAVASAFDVDTTTAKDLQSDDVYGTTVTPPTASPVAGVTPNPITVPGAAGPYPSPSPAPAVSPPPIAQFPVDRAQDMPRCQDFGGTPAKNGESHGFGNASANCDQNDGQVSAAGTFTPSNGALDVVANPMTSTASVQVLHSVAAGVTTTVKAAVRNVHLPPVSDPTVYIREIDTTATTVAHGRPGTASGTFQRKIYGFSSLGPPGSAASYSCSDDSATPCNPAKVAAALTAAFNMAGFNAAAYVPAPDGQYLNGTPGGYQAAVTKDQVLQASDATVNDDNSDAVTGLAVVLYNDGSAGRSREILQFAGVHAESHYGIYALGSTVDSFAGSSPSDAGAPSTGTAGVVGDTTPLSSAGPVVAPLPSSKTNPLVAIAHHIADVFQEGWRLLVSDPKTAALLAGVWGLLGMPVYLAIRRRSLVSKIARGVA